MQGEGNIIVCGMLLFFQCLLFNLFSALKQLNDREQLDTLIRALLRGDAHVYREPTALTNVCVPLPSKEGCRCHTRHYYLAEIGQDPAGNCCFLKHLMWQGLRFFCTVGILAHGRCRLKK